MDRRLDFPLSVSLHVVAVWLSDCPWVCGGGEGVRGRKAPGCGGPGTDLPWVWGPGDRPPLGVGALGTEGPWVWGPSGRKAPAGWGPETNDSWVSENLTLN